MSSVLRSPSLGPLVRGIKVSLLTPEKALGLAHSRSVDEYLNNLRNTQYAVSMTTIDVDSFPKFRSEVVSVYVKKLQHAWNMASGKARRAVELCLTPVEYDNLRTIIHGVLLNRDITGKLLLEPLDVARKRHRVAYVAGASSADDLVERLRALAYGHLSETLRQAVASGDVSKIDIDIDVDMILHMYKLVNDVGDKSLWYAAENVMAYYSILVLLRSKLWGLSVEPYVRLFAEKLGLISPRLGQGIVDENMDELSSGLLGYPWGNDVLRHVDKATLEGFANALDNTSPVIYRSIAYSTLVKYGEFSIGSLYAYLENLRMDMKLIIQSASMILEGVPMEEATKIFRPLSALK